MNSSNSLFPEPRWVKNLQVGDNVDWYYRVVESSKKKKKDGGDFMTLLLMDRSGKIPAKIWEHTERYAQLIQSGRIFRVAGEVTEYNQKKEIRVNHITPLTGQEKNLDEDDFREAAPFDTKEMLAEAKKLCERHIQKPFLRQLVDLYFERFGGMLEQHYGAQKIHHAYTGGLLEHTLQLMKLAEAIADLYHLNIELLLVGVLFHDIGKLQEFQVTPAVEITLSGGLLGHIVISYSLFQELKSRIPEFPDDWAVKIEHLIVSHHGEKEYGSPEVPKTQEAYVLHLVDLLDSRLSIFREVQKNSDSKVLFSEFQNSLGTRIFLDRE